MDAMNFSEALNAVKAGKRIARSGWNGKGMFLYLNPASDVVVSEGRPMAAGIPVGTPVHCNPYIMMKTADSNTTVVPWLASQTDILADDWSVLA